MDNLLSTIKKLDLQASDLEEIAKAVSWTRTVVSTYQGIRRLRFIHFLRSLEAAVAKDSKVAGLALEKQLERVVVKEYLSDYVDKVIINSSETVNAALALLFSRQARDKVDAETASQIVQAITGLTERQVTFFLGLHEFLLSRIATKNKNIVDDAGPFPVVFLNEGMREAILTTLATHAYVEEDIYSNVQDFKNRRIYLQDPTSRYDADFSVGVSSVTEAVFETLKEASSLIGSSHH